MPADECAYSLDAVGLMRTFSQSRENDTLDTRDLGGFFSFVKELGSRISVFS